MSDWRVSVTLSATSPLTLTDLHTAVGGWLLALSQEGTPILRITAENRDAAQLVLDTLDWLGLDWDESPDPATGGPYPPYATPPADNRYTAVAEHLCDNGDAYQDPDGVIRLYTPRSGTISYTDPQLGHLRFDLGQLPPPIMVTAVGEASRWFRQAIDDHHQHINHAVRPASQQSDLPALILFYRRMAWLSPTWVHMPPLHGPDAQTPVEQIQQEGYLPGAVFQQLLQLGWTPPDDRALWFRSDARRVWRLSALAAAPVTVERHTLIQLNRLYLARLSDADLAKQIKPYLEDYFGPLPPDPRWQNTLAHIIRPALDKLADAPDTAAWALDDAYEEDEAFLPSADAPALLARLVAELAHIVLLDQNTAVSILNGLEIAFPHTAVADLLTYTFTGHTQLNDLPAIMALLGKQKCLQRAADMMKQVS